MFDGRGIMAWYYIIGCRLCCLVIANGTLIVLRDQEMLEFIMNSKL